MQALREERIASLEVIRSSEDPIGFLARKLRVAKKGPAVIEIAIPCRQKDGEEYRIVVSAIAHAFVDIFPSRERQVANERLQRLQAIQSDLHETLRRERSELESLAEALGVELSDDASGAAVSPVLMKRSEKLLDALASEIARIEVAMIVDGDYEREKRTQDLKQFNDEYDRQMDRLVQALESQRMQDRRSKRFMVIDLKQRDVESLQERLDVVADQVFQAKIDLESPTRIELLSNGTLTEL
jgi:hypothetical protein